MKCTYGHPHSRLGVPIRLSAALCGWGHSCDNSAQRGDDTNTADVAHVSGGDD